MDTNFVIKKYSRLLKFLNILITIITVISLLIFLLLNEYEEAYRYYLFSSFHDPFDDSILYYITSYYDILFIIGTVVSFYVVFICLITLIVKDKKYKREIQLSMNGIIDKNKIMKKKILFYTIGLIDIIIVLHIIIFIR